MTTAQPSESSLWPYQHDGEDRESQTVAVLIHGLGGTPTVWDRVVPLLRPDIRAFAFSYAPRQGSGVDSFPEEPGAIDRWARDLTAGVEQIHADTVVLVGHSLGASVALRAALLSRTISALVLLGADADISQLGPRMTNIIDSIRRVGWDRWLDEQWRGNLPFSGPSVARSPDIVEEYERMLRTNDPDSYIAACDVIRTASPLTDEMHNVRMPAVVAVGSDDDRTPPASSRELASLLPDGRLEIVESVGHTLPLEAPELVARWTADMAVAGALNAAASTRRSQRNEVELPEGEDGG